jgi:GGDEF domain-containing protein
MGRLVKKIDTEARFRRFSKAVDEAVREACHEALWKHCQPVKDRIPADILLLGGDDLIVYLSADTAMPFAIEMARLFEEKTRLKLTAGDSDTFFRDILGEKGLTLSIGIAYGQSHTPIAMMVDQAEELLKSAKQKGASLAEQDAYVPSCIDFHPTNRFNQVSVADSRRQHLSSQTSEGEKIRLYRGPYTLEEAEALMEHAVRLKKSGIPNTRLHRLGEAPFLGKVSGTIETLTLYGRCRESTQKRAIGEALDHFNCFWPVMPWEQAEGEISTILVDLVHVAELTHVNE